MSTPLFSVTVDVLFNGDSHGTITEVVEASSVTEAEMKVVAEARNVLPSNRSVRPLVTIQVPVTSVGSFIEIEGNVYEVVKNDLTDSDEKFALRYREAL